MVVVVGGFVDVVVVVVDVVVVVAWEKMKVVLAGLLHKSPSHRHA